MAKRPLRWGTLQRSGNSRNKSPEGLPPSGKRVGIFSCQGHLLPGPCQLHGLPVRRCYRNSIVAILAKQIEAVSSPRYHPFHLSSSPVDSVVDVTLWSRKSTNTLSHSHHDWETEGQTPRTPRVPNLASIWSRPTTVYSTSTTPQPRLSIEKFLATSAREHSPHHPLRAPPRDRDHLPR